jgi:hypothetical protein
MTTHSSTVTSRHGEDPQTQQGRRIPLGVLLVLLALLAATTLAACARMPANEQAATHTPSGVLATPAHMHPGGMTLNGCASQEAPADAGSFTPDVIVGQSGPSDSSTHSIGLARGQRLEIRLVTVLHWTLTIADAAHILASTPPEGWYDRVRGSCVWRYTAMAPGHAQLSFTGVADCPPLEVCPAVEQALTYLVTIR